MAVTSFFSVGYQTFVLDTSTSGVDRDANLESKAHQDLGQLVIRNVGELCAMILWNDKLNSVS